MKRFDISFASKANEELRKWIKSQISEKGALYFPYYDRNSYDDYDDLDHDANFFTRRFG